MKVDSFIINIEKAPELSPSKRKAIERMNSNRLKGRPDELSLLESKKIMMSSAVTQANTITKTIIISGVSSMAHISINYYSLLSKLNERFVTNRLLNGASATIQERIFTIKLI